MLLVRYLETCLLQDVDGMGDLCIKSTFQRARLSGFYQRQVGLRFNSAVLRSYSSSGKDLPELILKINLNLKIKTLPKKGRHLIRNM